MKAKRAIFACCGILFILLFCCVASLVIAYAIGIKSLNDLQDEIEDNTEELNNSTDDATDNDFAYGNTNDISDEAEIITMDDGTQYQILTPQPDDLITSPVFITGKISGTWFFEASFPVELRTYFGDTIATGVATTTEEWMTTDLISYTAALTFTTPDEYYGEIFLLKSNPSGESQNDNQVSYPVRFQ